MWVDLTAIDEALSANAWHPSQVRFIPEMRVNAAVRTREGNRIKNGGEGMRWPERPGRLRRKVPVRIQSARAAREAGGGRG